MIGYVASIVGFVIAFLASKGYDLLKGPAGNVKVVVLIFCVLIAVLVGQMGTYAWQLHQVYTEEFSAMMSESDFFEFIIPRLRSDEEFTMQVLGDLGMGILFAALGCFSTLKAAGKKKQPQQTVAAEAQLPYLDQASKPAFEITDEQPAPQQNDQQKDDPWKLS